MYGLTRIRNKFLLKSLFFYIYLMNIISNQVYKMSETYNIVLKKQSSN